MLIRGTDHEIFRLKDELEANEGVGVTFYGKLPSSSSTTPPPSPGPSN
jgi:hypothetical protein